MLEIKINKVKVIQELSRRVSQNENGVKHYLEQAGISTSGHVTLDQLKALSQLNPQAFREMCYFLFPDLPSEEVFIGGDGSKKKKAATGTGEQVEEGAVVKDEDGKVITESSTSSIDWTHIIDGTINAAGNVLTGIFGKQPDSGAGAALQQQKEDMKMLLAVVFVALFFIVVFAFVVIKHKR